MKNLEAIVRNFALGLKHDFTQQIARNPRGFKKQVLQLIRHHLPPRRGRPRDPKIEAALAMVHQGKTVKEVLRIQIPGFEHLDTWGRMLAEKALRQALARGRIERAKAPPLV